MDWDQVEYTIELPGVYDGWSIALMKDGTLFNRWANEEGTGPAKGYERRYERTQHHIDTTKDLPREF